MTRHRAAQVLVVLFGVGFIAITAAIGINSYRNEEGLSETGNQLLLAVVSLIIGAVSGYLSRKVDEDPEDEIKSFVGTALAIVLGIVIVIAGVGLLWASFTRSDSILQANSLNLLTVILGGTVGALAAYLGLNPQQYGPIIEDKYDDRKKKGPSSER